MKDLNLFGEDHTCIDALTNFVCHPSSSHHDSTTPSSSTTSSSHADVSADHAKECTTKYDLKLDADKKYFDCNKDHYGFINGDKFVAAKSTHTDVKPTTDSSKSITTPKTTTSSAKTTK